MGAFDNEDHEGLVERLKIDPPLKSAPAV